MLTVAGPGALADPRQLPAQPGTSIALRLDGSTSAWTNYYSLVDASGLALAADDRSRNYQYIGAKPLVMATMSDYATWYHQYLDLSAYA